MGAAIFTRGVIPVCLGILLALGVSFLLHNVVGMSVGDAQAAGTAIGIGVAVPLSLRRRTKGTRSSKGTRYPY